jgi:hypothetical protein
MAEADVEVTDVQALWLPLGLALLLIMMLIGWLIRCWMECSALVPELSTKAVLITGT